MRGIKWRENTFVTTINPNKSALIKLSSIITSLRPVAQRVVTTFAEKKRGRYF